MDWHHQPIRHIDDRSGRARPLFLARTFGAMQDFAMSQLGGRLIQQGLDVTAESCG